MDPGTADDSRLRRLVAARAQFGCGTLDRIGLEMDDLPAATQVTTI